MRTIWLHSLRFVLKIGLFFYFKQFKVVGKSTIPTDKPLLILGNHQSALIDPLLLAVSFKQFAYYLTRAGVFQKKLVKAILNSVNMLPVYRIRDGWGTISNNNPVFERCVKLLAASNSVVIFPEGSHSLVRTVRPLSKGFTRIVLDTMERYPETDLHLLCVGFNYEDAVGFPDRTSVLFGKPIAVKSLLKNDTFENISILKSTVQSELEQLTVHIPSENYETTLSKLEDMGVDYLNPNAVNSCIQSDFKDCEKKVRTSSVLHKILKPLVYINLCLPVLFWRYLVKPKIKEAEFVATFRFAVSMVLVPLWLLGIAFVLIFSIGMEIAILYFLTSILLMLGYVKA